MGEMIVGDPDDPIKRSVLQARRILVGASAPRAIAKRQKDRLLRWHTTISEEKSFLIDHEIQRGLCNIGDKPLNTI